MIILQSFVDALNMLIAGAKVNPLFTAGMLVLAIVLIGIVIVSLEDREPK